MKTIDVIIVGGGQAGLVLGYTLSKAQVNFLILEKGRIAQSWRDRYDSLHLITPKQFFALYGLNPSSIANQYNIRLLKDLK